MIEYTKQNPLRCFFAFEGYNSQGMALNRLKESFPDFDWICVGRSEIDKYAIQAADAVFPENKGKNYGDISKIVWDTVPDFDLFTMSSPCQDFSMAGQQKGGAEGSGTRSSLLWECRKAIIAKRPKYILFENVKALISEKFLPYFLKWQDELSGYGYSNFSQVLNSKDFGVPQNRERIFMVSILDFDGMYHFPEPFLLDKRLRDVLEEDVDEKYFLSDKMCEYLNRHNKGVIDKGGISRTVLADYYKTDKLGNYVLDRVIQVANIADEKGFSNPQIGRIYSPNGISPTLDTCGGGNREPKILTPLRTEEGRRLRKLHGGKENFKHRELVPREDGVSNTITTVQKDNLLLTPRIVAMRGRGEGNEQQLEMGGEISNALTTVQKDNMLLVLDQVKDMVKDRRAGRGATAVLEQDGTIRSCYDVGTHNASISEMIVQYEDNPALTVTSSHQPKVYGDTTRFRIRKLTERECFRLMDVSESDIDKIQASGVSRSQQYKMAGNSIVVSCLYHIFRKMFTEQQCESQQLSLF